ncbi:MAG: capsule biosynthesis protein [Hyphomicrobiaceae bacterium]
MQDRPQRSSDLPTIELTPLVEEIGQDDAPPSWLSWSSIRQWIQRNRSYGLMVVLPTAVALFYFTLVAADRYESEVRFVVRSPSTSAASQITSLVQGTGIVRSADDAYIVHDYIQSRDAVRALGDDVDLVARLQRPEADILWRYPGLLRTPSAEGLWRHFQSFINVDFDSTTGITTLKVQAFRPDDARVIAQALVDRSERLINGMSERAHRETIRAASVELERTRQRARVTLADISDFRRRHELIDPSRITKVALETITRLSVEIAKSNAELAELRSQAANSPQAKSLEQRVAAYEQQIRKERTSLAGNDNSLAPIIADYERLMLEREFAERAFASAQTALDLARIDAERQRLFIERVSRAMTPDYAKYPWRLLDSLAVFLLCSMVYALGKRILSDVRSHGGQ